MTIDITAPAMIERQSLMMGCGVTPAQINMMINASDEIIAKSIADAKAAIPALTGERLEKAQNLLKAFEIEASLRA